jgi:hypothetical protein
MMTRAVGEIYAYVHTRTCTCTHSDMHVARKAGFPLTSASVARGKGAWAPFRSALSTAISESLALIVASSSLTLRAAASSARSRQPMIPGSTGSSAASCLHWVATKTKIRNASTHHRRVVIQNGACHRGDDLKKKHVSVPFRPVSVPPEFAPPQKSAERSKPQREDRNHVDAKLRRVISGGDAAAVGHEFS